MAKAQRQRPEKRRVGNSCLFHILFSLSLPRKVLSFNGYGGKVYCAHSNFSVSSLSLNFETETKWRLVEKQRWLSSA